MPHAQLKKVVLDCNEANVGFYEKVLPLPMILMALKQFSGWIQAQRKPNGSVFRVNHAIIRVLRVETKFFKQRIAPPENILVNRKIYLSSFENLFVQLGSLHVAWRDLHLERGRSG